jgi:hypothetical protein
MSPRVLERSTWAWWSARRDLRRSAWLSREVYNAVRKLRVRYDHE